MIIRKVIAASTLLVLSLCAVAALGAAQDPHPVVAMSITPTDGATKTLTAPESGTATLTLKDGHEFGFRPTMLDDQGTRIVITVFDMGDKSSVVREIGEVEVKGGASEVASKTTPAFKVKATKVTSTT
jgi:hypothetical protein